MVSEKSTVFRPGAAAVTVYGPPAVALAVKGADATPMLLVDALIVAVELLNVPLAPLAGAVNVTTRPGTGLLAESLTVTASGLRNAVFTAALCGVVLAFAFIVYGVLVREKSTVVRPGTAAVTA